MVYHSAYLSHLNPMPAPAIHGVWEHRFLQGFKAVAIATAAISLAPFIFNQGALGEVALANTLSFCSAGEATGLTRVVSGIMAQIPVVGGYLATGGIFNGIASLAIGLTGVAASRMLEKRHHPTAAKIVRWASIATSVLVSLPAILPALGMGFHYIGLISDNDMIQQWAFSAFEALGKMGSSSLTSAAWQSGSALIASASHLIACGAASASTVWVTSAAQRHSPSFTVQATGSLAEPVKKSPASLIAVA